MDLIQSWLAVFEINVIISKLLYCIQCYNCNNDSDNVDLIVIMPVMIPIK